MKAMILFFIIIVVVLVIVAIANRLLFLMMVEYLKEEGILYPDREAMIKAAAALITDKIRFKRRWY